MWIMRRLHIKLKLNDWRLSLFQNKFFVRENGSYTSKYTYDYLLFKLYILYTLSNFYRRAAKRATSFITINREIYFSFAEGSNPIWFFVIEPVTFCIVLLIILLSILSCFWIV